MAGDESRGRWWDWTWEEEQWEWKYLLCCYVSAAVCKVLWIGEEEEEARDAKRNTSSAGSVCRESRSHGYVDQGSSRQINDQVMHAYTGRLAKTRIRKLYQWRIEGGCFDPFTRVDEQVCDANSGG